MKPIENISHSVFAIGKSYLVLDSDGIEYIDEDGNNSDTEITIASIFPCPTSTCNLINKPLQCEGIQFEDEDGQVWCGVQRDFEEVAP